MKTQKKVTHNIPKLVGLILIVLSGLILLSPSFYDTKLLDDIFTGSFFLNYFIAGGYLFFILLRRIILQNWNIFKIDSGCFKLFVVLFTISAFSLNRNMHLFAEPVFWLKAYIIITQLSLILFAYKEKLPESFIEPLYFVFGMGVIIALYFSILFFPISIFGLLFCWFLGISLHGIVQLVWLTVFIIPVFKTKSKIAQTYYLSGVIIPIVFVGFYMMKWSQTQDVITKLKNKSSVDLPKWVTLSQNLPDNQFTEWALKSRLINESNSSIWEFDFFGMGTFNEVKQHDPLTVISYNILGELGVDRDIQIKILASKYKYRHQAIPRLWSDENLITKNIETNIEIMPDYRLAYIEKLITIENQENNNFSWFSGDEEAIYTFHLPEGSVVTSLSLWINGIEEKARLTTKEKADSAYKTIVGVEVRDPSVVHWQEGNRLLVRVFPCTIEENRVFKLGVTVPLLVEDNELVLENIYFEGPDYTDAKETATVKITSNNKSIDPDMPGFFKHKGEEYIHKGNYISNWKISLPETKMNENYFSFNGNSYKLDELKRKNTIFNAEKIYLDINNSWSESEFNEVMDLLKSKKVYAFTDKLEKLSDNNKDDIFFKLHSLNFSLFPVYEIDNSKNSMLITKSNSDSPLFEDLIETSFYTKTINYLANNHKKIKLFDINNNLTIYLKVLKEYDVFDCYNGGIATLKDIISKNYFPIISESENSIAIESSEIEIIKDTLKHKSEAPNHLMRLFAFNRIMNDIGGRFLDKNYIDNELINIAKEAYVVSPVSSLVVLESKEDYERFDIDEVDSNSSLENAFHESSGAVPEPHEWALIILSIIIILYLTYKRKFKLNYNRKN